jgi:hypothetical protein
MNFKQRNTRILRSVRAKQGKPVQLIPDSWIFYRKVHICTHSWPARNEASDTAPSKEGNKTSRPFQRVRLTDCPFRFVVQMVRYENDWRLEVMRGLFCHNHQVGPDTYAAYPIARGIEDVTAEVEAAVMVKMGKKRSEIYDYLLEKDQNVVKRDVDNMVQKYRKAVSTTEDDSLVAAEVAKFVVKDVGNSVTVDETAKGDTGVISLTSHHMRDTYHRFPELLMVDCTHQTNRYDYMSRISTGLVQDSSRIHPGFIQDSFGARIHPRFIQDLPRIHAGLIGFLIKCVLYA